MCRSPRPRGSAPSAETTPSSLSSGPKTKARTKGRPASIFCSAPADALPLLTLWTFSFPFSLYFHLSPVSPARPRPPTQAGSTGGVMRSAFATRATKFTALPAGWRTAARECLSDAGYPLQTLRTASAPLMSFLSSLFFFFLEMAQLLYDDGRHKFWPAGC